MDEPSRWALSIAAGILGIAAVAAYSRTIPLYVVTSATTSQEEIRPTWRRHATTALGFIAALIGLGFLLRWQLEQGFEPQPLQLVQDARSGAFVLSLLIPLALLGLFLNRKGIEIKGKDAAELKQRLDAWLQRVAPGFVDGGSRLLKAVPVGEASEWTLLVVDVDGTTPTENTSAVLWCASATLQDQISQPLHWAPTSEFEHVSAEARWNLAFAGAGRHEASLKLVASGKDSTSYRHDFEVRSFLGLSSRQAAAWALVGGLISFTSNLALSLL